MFYGILTNFIGKMTVCLNNNWWKSILCLPLNRIHSFLKSANLTCMYGPMYLELDDYPPYYDKHHDNFETNVNENLRYCHGHTNYVGQNN